MLSSTGFAVNAHNARPPRRAVAFSFMRPWSVKRGGWTLLCLLLLGVLPLCHARATAPDSSAVARLRFPLLFAENSGQWEEGVRFGVIRGEDKVAFTGEGVYFFRPEEYTTALPQGESSGLNTRVKPGRRQTVARLGFVHPSPAMTVEGVERRETRLHFYKGSDAGTWREDVPNYTGVRYRNVWDGVDVEFVERDGKLLQRVLLAEGADLLILIIDRARMR